MNKIHNLNQFDAFIVPNGTYIEFFKKISKKYSKSLVFYDPYEINLFKKKKINLIVFKNYRILLSPLKLFIDFFFFYKIFKLILKNENKLIFIEGIYPTLYFTISKFLLNNNSKFVFWDSDWLLSDMYTNILSRFANNYVYPFLELKFINSSEKHVCSSELILNIKKKFWGKKLKKEMVFWPFPFTSTKIKKTENGKNLFKFVFFGKLQECKWMLKLIKLIQTYNKSAKRKVVIDIFGFENTFNTKIDNYITSNKLDFVKFNSVLHRKNIGKTLKNYNSGIIFLPKNSYSEYVIPSKIFNYLNFELPIITNFKKNEFKKIISNYKCGEYFDDKFKKKKLYNFIKKNNFYKKKISLLKKKLNDYNYEKITNQKYI